MLNRSKSPRTKRKWWRPCEGDYARSRECVLPTTKSCPLIRPAETSSCATPSAVSGWGTDQDQTDINKAQKQQRKKKGNTNKEIEKLVFEASWPQAKWRGRERWVKGLNGCGEVNINMEQVCNVKGDLNLPENYLLERIGHESAAAISVFH